MEKDNNKMAVAPNGVVLLTSEMSVISTDALNGARANVSKKHTPPADDAEESLIDWAPWGENDDFPLKLKDTIGQIGVLGSGIDINASMHYGNGIIWGKKQYDKGKINFVPEPCEDWDELEATQNIDLKQAELVESLETFYIAFPEIILNNGKTKVASVEILDTVYCRFKNKNKTTGHSEQVYFSSDFGESNNTEPKKINIWDPTDPTKYQKFVYPIMYRCFGNFYYPEPIYFACIRNGYADVAISVPKMLKYLYQNQMTIKYIIRVPLEVMKRKYICWDTPPDCDTMEQIMAWQLDKIKELQNEINNHLTSEKNAYKGLFTFTDGEGNSIEIEPIKSYLDSTKELPNAAAANSEFLFALQVDPALIGLGIPGGKNLSGSGSDKRESRKVKQSSLKRERLVSLKLPKLIALINGIDLIPTYLDTDTSQTMDENPTGKQTVVQS